MYPVLLTPAALVRIPAAPSDLLVTTDWLAAHLNDSRLVLFHIGARQTYDAGHIPGAQFLNPLRDLAAAPGNTGLSLELPPVEVGDLLVIRDVGAYGAVMASTYLRRPLAPEVLCDRSTWRVIRRRQTLDDMLRLES